MTRHLIVAAAVALCGETGILAAFSGAWGESLPATTQMEAAALSLSNAIDQPRHVLSLGRFFPGEPIVVMVEVLNDLRGAIEFRTVGAACGCTAMEIPRSPVEPGETALLPVVFDLADRIGPSSETVSYEMSSGGETRFLNLEFHLDLRSDIALTDRTLTVLCPPGPLAEQAVVSHPVGVVVSAEASLPATAEWRLESAAPLPAGIELVPVDDASAGLERRYVVQVRPALLTTEPGQFHLPCRVQVFNESGEIVLEGLRSIAVSIVPSVQLRTDPADVFLGVVAAEDLPVRRLVALSTVPPVTFRPLLPEGQAQEIGWRVAGIDDSQFRDSWDIEVTLQQPGTRGNHLISLPVDFEYRVAGEAPRQHLGTMEVQWITVE